MIKFILTWIKQLYTLYRDSKTIWVHFNGYYVENVLSEAKICGGVHLIPHSIMIEKMLFQLLTEHNSKLSVTNEKGLLLSILYNLEKTLYDGYGSHRVAEYINSLGVKTHNGRARELSSKRFSCPEGV